MRSTPVSKVHNNAHQKPRWGLVKAQADALTAEFSAPPIPVLEIAERNGVDVIFTDFGQSSNTVAGFCDFNESKILLNLRLIFVFKRVF